ncbi:hypothetical protein ACF0H5_024060 [Mactra antiquata]
MRIPVYEFLNGVFILINFINFASGNDKDVPSIIIEDCKSIAPKKIYVKWKPSFIPTSGTLDYTIRYKSRSGGFQTIATKKTELVIKNLTPNTRYIVKVRAGHGKKRGAWSTTYQLYTNERPAVTVGNIQGTIYVEEVNDSSVRLEWTTNLNVSLLGSFSGFQVILKSKEGITKKTANEYSVQFDDLTPENSYAANLYIVQNTGKRTRIGRTKFQTLEEQRSAPRKLRVKFVNHRTIALKWRHIKSSTSNETLTGYVLQYKQRSPETTEICEIHVDSLSKSYKINGLLPEVRYSVRVAGEFDNITGSFTEWLRLKTTSFSQDASDVKVFHISAYSVLLKWLPMEENITSLHLDIVSDLLSNDYAVPLVTNVKEMHLQLYTHAQHEVLKDLLPGSKYSATLTFKQNEQCVSYKYVEFETLLAHCDGRCNQSYNETLRDFQTHLRIIPVLDTEWLLTWQPLPWEQHSDDDVIPLSGEQHADNYVFLIRILGEPFMYELSSYLIPGSQNYHMLEEFSTAHAYTINIQLFKSDGGQPIISQYLLVLAMKDAIKNRVESTEILETESSSVWQPTSMDTFLVNVTAVTLTDVARVQELQGTGLSLVSTDDVIDELTNETVDYINLATPPHVDVIDDVMVVEGMTLDVTCRARGDPYPIITWLNMSTGESIIDNEETMNRYVSNVDTKYVGSSVLVDGRAYMAVRSFLSVENMTLSDSGEYACAAESSAGSNTTVFHINVIPQPPGPVLELHAHPTTPFEIEIAWQPSSNLSRDHPGHVIGYLVELLDEFSFVLKAKNVTVIGDVVFDELLADTFYGIKVSAFHQYSIGEPAVVVVKTPVIPDLGPPENITMTTINATTIQVQWSPPLMVSERKVLLRGYVFRHREVGTLFEEEIELPKMFTNVSIIDLKPECKYEVRVIALSEDAQVESSEWVQGNTSRESYMNETVPPPPPNAVFLKLLSGNIVVHWLPPNPDMNILVRAYTIEVYHNNTKRQAMEVAYEESNVKIYEVEMGILYRISVRAKNRAGLSIDRSEELKIPIEYVTQFPVRNFGGHALSSTKLELSWEAPEKGAFSTFVLSYTLAGDKKPELPGGGNLPASVRSYVVRSLKPDTGYVFSITPYLKDIRGVTVNTTVKTYTDKPSAPPQNVSLTVINSTTILIKCIPPQEGKNGPILEYKIAYRDKKERRFTVTEADDDEELNFFMTGLEPATVYEMRVRAFTVNGSGPWSSWLQDKTAKREPVQPKIPRNLTIITTESSITLNWLPPEQDLRELTGYILGFGRFIPEVIRESVTRDKTTFTFKNLDPETAYIVSIRSFNDFGESSALFELVTTL